MKKYKKNANYIITILLISSIILATLSIFIKYFVLNKDTYLKLLDKSNTYSKVEETLYKKMDSLLGNNASEELKKSIITNEDVKSEASNVVDYIIEDLKTGEINIPVINTEVYKKRVADILKTFTEFGNSSTNDLYFNDRFQIDNMVSIKSDFQYNKMAVANVISKDESISLNYENLATRAEIEAKGREILKQKGLTEAEARKKLAEKGMSEEQVWNMLRDNGYLDEEEKSDSTASNENINNSTTYNQEANSPNTSSEVKESTNGINSDANSVKDNKEKLSKEKIQGIVGTIISDDSKTFQEKLDAISNRLLEEAGIAIDEEIEKINLNKLIQSNKFKLLAKITSTFYKIHLIIVIFPIILILLLIKINLKDYKLILKSIGSASIVSGMILLLSVFIAYRLKLYDSININTVYIKDMLFLIVQKSLSILSISSVGILLVGIVFLIFSKLSIGKRMRN